MELYTIPLQSVPDQTFSVELGGQDCEIHIYLRYSFLYMDLTVDDEIVFQGQICLNNVNMIQYNHEKFNGEIRFVDTQGTDDPYYTELNERWYLVYVQP